MPSRLRAALAALPLIACLRIDAHASTADEVALRYYSAHGDGTRVAAETARLKRLDPAWRVPTDLASAKVGRADEAPLWDLYRQGRLDEIGDAIAQRQKAEPGWRPSDDLLLKMKTREIRATIMSSAKAGDWHAVTLTVKDIGTDWARDDAEALWAIAEAYARDNDSTRAFAIYGTLLREHKDASERRATIEFAIPLLPMSLTEKLIALGTRDARGGSEFDAIAIDITRARISAFLHDEQAKAVTDTERETFEASARASGNSAELGLVAWYDYKQQDYEGALTWFKLAIAQGGDAMIAHGLAHTLEHLGRRREAEEVAYAWREPLVNNAILFVDLLERDLTNGHPTFIEPDRIARYAQVTLASESGEGAQALAWYAYNTCNYTSALQWFERATAWLPKEATVYGYTLSLQRLHRAKEFRDVVNRYDGLFPNVVGLAFEEETRKPRPDCDATRRATAAATATPATAVDWTGRTMVDTLRPQPATYGDLRANRATRVSVPTPDMVSTGVSGRSVLRKVTEFPVAVAPENVLRFSALHNLSGARLSSRAAPPDAPLVARRVPGVGPMPYERWGFALAPGYDGTREATSPTAAERDAPAGTLWREDQSLRDNGYRRASASNALTRPALPKATGSAASPDPGRS